MIRFEQVSKTYDDGTQAVSNLNISIPQGELFVFIGPSGCGKTTSMKMINRLLDPSSGSIYINNKNIKEYDIYQLRWNIGYVLQQIALFPHLTIGENIAIVPEMKKWPKRQIRQRCRELLSMVGLEPSVYLNKKPAELSGGEQQRIGVIRALAADPDIILMDEPFSALDPISREQLQQQVRELQRSIQKTIVFVTHDMNEAVRLGDRICLMNKGCIEQCGTPDELLHQPASSFVQTFFSNRHEHLLFSDEIRASGER